MTKKQEFERYLAQTSSSPVLLEIEKAEGIYLYDVTGKKYIDFISGISVNNLGHRHPEVMQAIQSQMDKYLYLMVYGEYVLDPQIQLAKKLSEVLPASLNSTYFVNSGSEAVEGALKLAKRYTEKTEIITFQNGYHGSTHGALSVMGNELFKTAFRPLLPDIKKIPFNDVDFLSSITQKTAGVIIEPVQGEAGIRVADKLFLQQLKKRCNEAGALLIFDEVQTAFGRTGSLFAFEQYDLIPDILVLAKGLGGGMPLGAFIASKQIMETLMTQPPLGHITTFGGHPLSCAAALASLQVLIKETYISQVKKKEQLLRTFFTHKEITEVRSAGLMMAVEFKTALIAKAVIEECLKQGIITDWFLFDAKSMRIAPPLIITEEDIIQTGEKIKAIIEDVHSITSRVLGNKLR